MKTDTLEAFRGQHRPDDVINPPLSPLHLQQPGSHLWSTPEEQKQEEHQQQQHEQGEQNHMKNSSDSKERMQRRLAQVQAYCSRRKTKIRSRSNPPLCSSRHRSEFCILGKVGSTFWTRFYKILRDSSSDTLDSPYKLPLSTNERCARGRDGKVSVSRQEVLALFVRDPFSRVFSAYVDKLVSPNPIYWKSWGKPAMIMDMMDQNSVQCGQHVTFKQFFHFVTKRLHDIDVHVIPMTELCDPCQRHYNVVGNMETLPDDLSYLMSLLNVTFRSDVHLSREGKLDAIFDSIQGPFSWMKDIKKCMSTPKMGKKIWAKLQIRGLISSSLDYPLGTRDLTHMTAEEFNQIAVEAHMNSTDEHGLSQQKKEVFVEAFRTVPVQDLQEFVRVYADDFEAFGYDTSRVMKLRQDETFTGTGAFDINKKWIIQKKQMTL